MVENNYSDTSAIGTNGDWVTQSFPSSPSISKNTFLEGSQSKPTRALPAGPEDRCSLQTQPPCTQPNRQLSRDGDPSSRGDDVRGASKPAQQVQTNLITEPAGDSGSEYLESARGSSVEKWKASICSLSSLTVQLSGARRRTHSFPSPVHSSPCTRVWPQREEVLVFTPNSSAFVIFHLLPGIRLSVEGNRMQKSRKTKRPLCAHGAAVMDKGPHGQGTEARGRWVVAVGGWSDSIFGKGRRSTTLPGSPP